MANQDAATSPSSAGLRDFQPKWHPLIISLLPLFGFGSTHKPDNQAATLGINSVPFFVLDDRYAISGAQAPELFLSALEKARADDAANAKHVTDRH